MLLLLLLLLLLPTKPNQPNQPTRYAAAAGRLDSLQRLLDGGALSGTACRAAPVCGDGRKRAGWTALHFATESGAIDCVVALTKAANLRPAAAAAALPKPPGGRGPKRGSKRGSKRVSLLPPAPHASELDARTDDGLALTAAMLAAQRAGSDAHLVILRVLVQVRTH